MRHWRRAPKSSLLLVFILALGVAVFFSIRLANRAAVAGFTLFTETLTGNSDLILVPPAGYLDEPLLSELREALGELPVHLFPVLEATASQPAREVGDDGFNAEQYEVVGVDLVALGNLVYLEPELAKPAVSLERSTRSNWDIQGGLRQVFISPRLATDQSLEVGDRLEVILNTDLVELEIAGLLPEKSFQAPTPANLLVMDLPALQGLLHQPGRFSRLEVRLPQGTHHSTWLKETEHRLQAISGGRYDLVTPETERSAAQTMTQAFRLNLTVLSALALLVGFYLILQALEAAVIRRRTEIGILRSLGVTPRQIQRAWLVESLTLGVLGSAIGLAGGYLGAHAAVGAVARTVNTLYHGTTASAARLDFTECLLALGLGSLGALAAGWLPAREAASTPPAQVLRAGIRGGGLGFLSRPLLGWTLMAGGVALSFLPPLSLGNHGRFPLAGYGAALAWVIGGSILGSSFLGPLAKGFSGAARRFPLARYALSQLRRPSGRHRLTVAGLVLAVGMASGMSILIESFEHTMVSWINQTLKADLYVAARGVGNASNRNSIQPDTLTRLIGDPQVAGVDSARAKPLRWQGVQTTLVGLALAPLERGRQLVWIRPPAPDTPSLTPTADGLAPAWISESFQERFTTRVGDILSLPTPNGIQAVKVTAVFADYGNERGSIAVDLDQLAAWFGDPTVTTLAVYLRETIEPDTVRRRWMVEHPGLTVRSNARLREEVMLVFRQTFSVTYVLKGIAVVVALAGLALALVGLLLERRSELLTLKELGMTRAQLASATGLEGVCLAALGTAVGLGLSLALGWLLIFVINKQSFGWTLAFELPWFQLCALGGATLLSSWTVAWLAGWWGATLPAEQEE